MSRILFALTTSAFVAISAFSQSTWFSNREYGFSMLEPQGWTVIEKRTLDENLDNIDLSGPAKTRLLTEDEGSVILFAFAKYVPNTKRGLNPKIEARVISNGLNRPLSFEEFAPAIRQAFLSLRSNYIGHSYLVAPTSIDVFGGRGVYQISRFTMRTRGRAEYTVRSRTYAFPYRTYYFQISFVDEIGGEDCSALFDELARSIKIGNYL